MAGVAALLVSLGLEGQEVADRIIATAADAGARRSQYGAGIVDARAAVAGLGPDDPGDPDDPDDPDPTAGASP